MKPALPRPEGCPGAERGSALLIGLMLLVVMTLLGVSAMQSTTLEERMAGNQKDRGLAFQAAEAALRDAEAFIRTDTDGPFNPLNEEDFPSLCIFSRGVCRSTPDTPKWKDLIPYDSAWIWASREVSTTLAGRLTGVDSPPRYLIEYLGFQGLHTHFEPGQPCEALYLITAKATGANPETTVFLQSLYKNRVGVCRHRY